MVSLLNGTALQTSCISSVEAVKLSVVMESVATDLKIFHVKGVIKAREARFEIINLLRVRVRVCACACVLPLNLDITYFPCSPFFIPSTACAMTKYNLKGVLPYRLKNTSVT